MDQVVRSMPSLLPTFTPSPPSLDGFEQGPAITLDPEEVSALLDPEEVSALLDPEEVSGLLDPKEIRQLPDLADNNL